MHQGIAGDELRAVAAWMDDLGLEPGSFARVEPLRGGTQNVVVLLERGGRRYVLRRGPVHLRPTSNDSMRREMRVLGALAGTAVPHPRLIAACPDGEPLGGAAFYLMEAVDGFNPSDSLPPLHAGSPAVRHAMGLAAIDALAALGALDPDALGLGDLGRPDGYLERQVSRWMRELDSYSKYAEWPGPRIPGLERVTAWLDANLPPGFTPGLSHGDYHFGNLLFRFDGPDVAAIVDWEMCTVGDPLVDLGWLLATTASLSGADAPTSPLIAAGGLPDRDEMIARYSGASARDLSSLIWYEVLACFRLGIILEGTHARSFAGHASPRTGALLHAVALSLFAHADVLISQGSPCRSTSP